MTREDGWIDLAHVLSNDLPRISTFPAPHFDHFLSRPQDPMNVTRINMVCHVGTHVDAPCHFIDGGESIDQLAVSRLTGNGVVCRVDTKDDQVYGVESLIDREQIRAGDIVLLDTGWSRYFGSDRYDDHHPSLSLELAHWLVERGVSLVAVDTPTPDLPVAVRPSGFDWPVHKVLLSAGVLISEHVTNLATLSGKRVEAMFAPLSIEGSDGGPVRALARAL